MGTKAVSDKGRKAPKLKEVRSIEDVPEFNTDEEAAEFWETHAPGPAFFDGIEEVDESDLPRPQKSPVPVRLDDDVVARLKRLAQRRDKGYQALLEEFVLERLYEEEKREGMVGG